MRDDKLREGLESARRDVVALMATKGLPTPAKADLARLANKLGDLAAISPEAGPQQAGEVMSGGFWWACIWAVLKALGSWPLHW